jgi:branched-chain amino acid transport system substrate-binding protein
LSFPKVGTKTAVIPAKAGIQFIKKQENTMLNLSPKKILATTLQLLVLVWVSNIFAITATQNKASTPIQIGVIYNLTGTQSALDLPALQGAKLATDEINATGGVLGKKLQLVIRNGKSNTGSVTTAAQKLTADPKITTIIGLNDTDMATAVIDPIVKSKKLFLTSGATSPKLAEAAEGHICLACFVDSDQGAVAAEFILEKLQAKNVYILTQEDMTYPKLISTYFTKRYQALGGDVIAEDNFTAAKNDISAQLSKLQKATTQPQVIYVATEPALAAKIIQEIRGYGFKQPIFGGDSFDNDDVAKIKSDNLGTIYFTAHAFLDASNPDPQVGKFINAYQKTYHKKPESSFAALGYDTVKLLAQAINTAQTTAAIEIQNALLNTKDFDGLTGTIIRVGDDCIPVKTVNIVRLENGKHVLENEKVSSLDKRH